VATGEIRCHNPAASCLFIDLRSESTVPHTPTSISRTGHRIWYESAGDSGTPVLLIMGFTMPGSAWRWQVDELSRHHRVAWFDHAGLGKSGPLSVRRLTMRHLSDDAVSVMETLGWDEAHVVGISMGGMIAQHVGLRFRDRVRSLTLAATHCGGFPNVVPPLDGLRSFLRVQRARSREGRLDALSELLFSSEFRRSQPERCKELLLADFRRPPKLRTSLAQLHAIFRHRTAERLHELEELPVMIIRPGEDRLIDPRESDRLSRLLPSARVVRVDDAGHAVSRQNADAFNRELLRHLAEADDT
jgi:pimeloyl-ACP methyl ester carboxylesterase